MSREKPTTPVIFPSSGPFKQASAATSIQRQPCMISSGCVGRAGTCRGTADSLDSIWLDAA